MNVLKRIIFLGLALNLYFAQISPAQEKIDFTEAVGRAPLALPDYRKTALHEALRSAVQDAVGVQVNSDTVVRDALLIKDKILVKSEGYVRKYEILDERQTTGEYEVRIKAQVSATQLNKDLFLNGIDVEQVYDWAGKPRLVVLVTDLIDDKPSPTPFLQNEIEGLFRNKGITVIDRDQLKNIQLRDVELAFNDPRKALALGKRFGAEIVVVGKSVSKFSRELDIAGFRQYFYTTQLDARAYRTSNGEVLISKVYADDPQTDTSAMGKHDAAVRSAREVVGQNANDIVFRLVKNWYEGMTRAATFQVILSGIKGAELSALVKDLNQRPDVVQVQRRGFNSGTAELEIEYNGVQSTLIDMLESNTVLPLVLTNEEPFRFSLEKQ